ncbi:MAG: RagB/SusD family nutrient uptake outer membrane protein, partial [Bacteroidales bacterium]|nr:RagB/SusD family nutrient uptake outer membrane protein [Bacteroidales bacterium]
IRGERRAELSFDNTRNWDFIRWRLWSDPKYDGYIRGALVPVMDLREAKPSTIFIREYVRESDNSYMRPTTRNQRVCYYKSIPGITTNHLIQNPGW